MSENKDLYALKEISMINITVAEKEKCSGCHACKAECPKKCITMVTDHDGFLYPKVDSSACILCGKCEKVCQYIHHLIATNTPIAYACYNLDAEARERSSSGGIFILLSNWIIQQDGIVYGAAFSDDGLSVHHIAVNDSNELYKLQGSKYIQSIIGDSYEKVRINLEDGRFVLFTGTPCQIDGLLHYLKKDYARLFTQDIICHGVPSSKVWRKYIAYQQECHNARLLTDPLPSFRSKNNGWKKYSVSLLFNDDSRYLSFYRDDFYMKAFLGNLSLRPSCYQCHSKSKQRNSDITLGDFWGIEEQCPDMYNSMGTSLVIVNTEKGRKLLEQIKDYLKYQAVDYEKAITDNTPLYTSVKKNEKREDFFSKLDKVRFDKLVRK